MRSHQLLTIVAMIVTLGSTACSNQASLAQATAVQATAIAQAQATGMAVAQATSTAQTLATLMAQPPTGTPTPVPTKAATAIPLTKAPAAVQPTLASSMPGVDLVAVRGKESCVNKYVSANYVWEAEADPNGRKMFYWDEKWTVYPQYARPNIKFKTVMADCNKDTKQCKGFTADFCVYVDGGAPPGGIYNTDVILIIASAYPNGTGVHLLTRFSTPFSWYIK